MRVVKSLYAQVLIGIALGIAVGALWPHVGVALKPLGDAGAGFITLALTLGAVGTIPVAAMAMILGVDRFMSECRALTNVIGNGVAALVVARWEGTLDRGRLRAELHASPNRPQGARSAWTAKAPGATTSSSNGSGARSNTRKSI